MRSAISVEANLAATIKSKPSLHVITGYNTDVRHNDVVYHVQTEDKGTNNPYIESLVYVGGQVLAAKRFSYADLANQANSSSTVVDRMEKQHRTVIAAIRQGKFEGKLGRRPAPKRQETDRLDDVIADLPPEPASGAHATGPSAPAASASLDETKGGEAATDLRELDPVAPADQSARSSIGASKASPESVQTLDQVILEYLTSESDQEQLLLLVEQTDFNLGEHADVTVTTRASKSGSPIRGADVQVRMISTVDEPQVLAKGETDDDGSLALSFEIPRVAGGTAALIISAASDIGRAELKHLL